MKRPLVDLLPTGIKVARWMAYVGLVCGVVYSVGGFSYDLLTTGLNWGTAMAFMALLGMPAVFATFGFLCGALFALGVRGIGRILGRGGG